MHFELLPRSPSFQTFSNVRKGFVLALLQPAIPRLESFRLLDLEGAADVVLDVVIGEVLAAFVADTPGVSSGAPLHAADLEDSEIVAGRCLRTGNQAGVQTTLALHQADPVADQTSGDFCPLQFLYCLTLGQDLRLQLYDRQRDQQRQ